MRRLGNVLVTGGAGFIGSSLVRHLLRQEGVGKVLVLDKLTYAGNRANLDGPDRDPRFLFAEGDVNDRGLVSELMEREGITGIFHLAAESHVDRSIEDSTDFIATNVCGTGTLLEVARAAGVPLLHCSTDEVYGSIESPGKAKEDAPLNPSSAYAASKAGADLLCLAAARTHRQDVIITRCTNNYGPRQYPEKLIPFFIKKALRDEPLPLYGDGLQIRDWIHVDDHCRGMLAAWKTGKVGQIFHFSGHCERTNIGIARSILDALRKPHSLLSHVDDRPGHDRRYSLDTEKSLMWFGWQPEVSFKEGFPDVVRALAAELRD
ncbi:MAG: dTDP-glucose 4,6-dehydratase [Verrucomicrobiota bacterium JB023]|nr:dTDP-glucose 4,6-dehydratase [Verrucomicrobiota bacterium JB023]